MIDRLPIVCTGARTHATVWLPWSFVRYRSEDGSTELVRIEPGDFEGVTCPSCGCLWPGGDLVELIEVARVLLDAGVDEFDVSGFSTGQG